jgi:hypothetical protein
MASTEKAAVDVVTGARRDRPAADALLERRAVDLDRRVRDHLGGRSRPDELDRRRRSSPTSPADVERELRDRAAPRASANDLIPRSKLLKRVSPLAVVTRVSFESGEAERGPAGPRLL